MYKKGGRLAVLVIFDVRHLIPSPQRTTPSAGELAVAYSFFGIRPAR
jgi:hypothetical protein